MWLLDRALVPRPDALLQLVSALDRVPATESPAVLAGVVLERGGGVERSRGFWFRNDDVEPAMAGASSRLLPIRATAGPVLVRSTTAAANMPRRGDPLAPPAVFEWTAMLLRSQFGYLVTDSEYDAIEPARDPLSDPRTVARLMFGHAFRRLDRLRVGYELLERAGSWLSRRGPRA